MTVEKAGVKMGGRGGAQKPSKGLTPSYVPTKKEHDAAVKRAEADMKKHGFKTVEELTAYYDKKRGY